MKKPDQKGRRTFQVVPYERVNGKLLYKPTIKHEILDSINERLTQGILSIEEALVQIKRVFLPKLRGNYGLPETTALDIAISDDNMRIFRSLWAAEYRRKQMESKETAEYQFLCALRLLEPLSLQSSSIDDIQNLWDQKLRGTRHKRYGGRINQLLKHVGRSELISLHRKDQPETRFVSWTELNQILKKIDDQILCDLYKALWATGCRLGEIFALGPSDLRADGRILINKQLARDGRIKPFTKNKIKHTTIVVPRGREALERWLAFEDKQSYLKKCTHPLIYASRETFPRNQSKWISPHKLRHSFVHHLVASGISLHDIKDLIGDTLQTTEETYSGWVMADESIAHVLKKLS